MRDKEDSKRVSEEPPEWAKDHMNDDAACRCGDCGGWMTAVRPGKNQCDNPSCSESTNVGFDRERVAASAARWAKQFPPGTDVGDLGRALLVLLDANDDLKAKLEKVKSFTLHDPDCDHRYRTEIGRVESALRHLRSVNATEAVGLTNAFAALRELLAALPSARASQEFSDVAKVRADVLKEDRDRLLEALEGLLYAPGGGLTVADEKARSAALVAIAKTGMEGEG